MAEITSTFEFRFDDERERVDFEAAFKGWLKDYQQRQAIFRMLAKTYGEPVPETGTGTTAGLTGSSSTHPPHHYDSTASGLLTIGETTIVLSDGTTISTEGIYVDICPWF